MILYRTDSKKVIKTCIIENRHPVKFISWSEGYQYLAMMSKFNIIIADVKLNILATIAETSKIKSGCWDTNNVFIYATSNHLKYALFTGDYGIIKTLAEPLYLAQARGKKVTAVDRELNVRTFNVDTTEYMFKLSLVHGKKKEILKIIKTSRLVGESIIGYLQKKGYPEIALHFVEDPKTKFALALECGDLDRAFDCAQEMNDNVCWEKLAQVALQQGDFEKYANSLVKTKSLDKLSFHFMLSGNRSRQEQLTQIGKQMKNTESVFHNSMLLGNVEERVSILADAGQVGLAYVLAKNHGLQEQANALAEDMTEEQLEKLEVQLQKESTLLFPPHPIVPEEGWGNWPCKEVNKVDPFENLPQYVFAPVDDESDEHVEDEDEVDEDDSMGLDDDLLDISDIGEGEGADADWSEDFEFDDVVVDSQDELGDDDDVVICPQQGDSFRSKWTGFEQVASSICAGEFNGAMSVLNHSHRISNFPVLKEHFVRCFQSSAAEIPGIPGSRSISVPVLEPQSEESSELEENIERFPSIPYTFNSVKKIMKTSLTLIDGWKRLDKALVSFRECLYATLFTYAKDKQEKQLIRDFQNRCSHYIAAIRCYKKAQELKNKPQSLNYRLHVISYDLLPRDLALPLMTAINQAKKMKMARTTAQLCRKYFNLLKTHKKRLPEKFKQYAPTMKKLLQKQEEINEDKPGLSYDIRLSRDEQSICPLTFEYIQCEAGVTLTSTFDVDEFKNSSKGTTSPTCNLCKVGLKPTYI